MMTIAVRRPMRLAPAGLGFGKVRQPASVAKPPPVVDGVEFEFREGARVPRGWHATPKGEAEIQRRIAALVAAGPPIYAPLPSGMSLNEAAITQSSNPRYFPAAVGLDRRTGEAIGLPSAELVRYKIARSASFQVGTRGGGRYTDPETGATYDPPNPTDPPPGFVSGQRFLEGSALDAVQRKYGIPAGRYFWVEFPRLGGGWRTFLVRDIDTPKGGTLANMGQIGMIAIGALGAILAIPTGGASVAIAATIAAANQVRVARIKAASAKRAGQAEAATMEAEVTEAERQLGAKADEIYTQNAAKFQAAGYDAARWRGLTLDEKIALIERLSQGTLQPTPEAARVVAETQASVNAAISSAVQSGAATAPRNERQPDPPHRPAESESPKSEVVATPPPTEKKKGGGLLWLLAVPAVWAATR